MYLIFSGDPVGIPAGDVSEQRICDEQRAKSGLIMMRPIRRFINVAFLVLPGAALVFDMPQTLFGPNGFVSCRLFVSRKLS